MYEFLPFLVLMAACGGWFYACAAMAGRSPGIRYASAIAGAAEFTVLLLVIRPIIERQRFFRGALYDHGDFGAIMLYIALPCLIAVFVSGLALRRVLAQEPMTSSSDGQNHSQQEAVPPSPTNQ